MGSKDNKKIAIFIYSMAAGGAERVVSNLLFYLKEHFELELILMNDTCFFNTWGVKLRFLEKSFANENLIFKFIKLIPLAFSLKALAKAQGYKAMLVYLNRPCYIAGLASIFGLKTKLIINECSTPSLIYAGFRPRALINKALIFICYKRASLLLANSHDTCYELRSFLKKDVLFMPNALDIKTINEYKIYKNDPKINCDFLLNIGRLDEGKNHLLLIKAYKEINPKEYLFIIGDGPLKNQLKELIAKLGLENRVFLLGFRRDIYGYLYRTSLLISSSSYEGFSNVLIEALACGTKVYSTEHKNGARELLGLNEFGLLAPVCDERAFVAGLRRAILACKIKPLIASFKKTRLKKSSYFTKPYFYPKKELLKARVASFSLENVGKSICQLL